MSARQIALEVSIHRSLHAKLTHRSRRRHGVRNSLSISEQHARVYVINFASTLIMKPHVEASASGVLWSFFDFMAHERSTLAGGLISQSLLNRLTTPEPLSSSYSTLQFQTWFPIYSLRLLCAFVCEFLPRTHFLCALLMLLEQSRGVWW